MTQGLLQKTTEEQGACEAIGDKLCKKAVCLMDDITALADRYYITLSALLNSLKYSIICLSNLFSNYTVISFYKPLI